MPYTFPNFKLGIKGLMDGKATIKNTYNNDTAISNKLK